MNYIPPVQLCLEKESIRDGCFDGVSAEIPALSCRDRLSVREEAEVTRVTPGQLDPPRASAIPLCRGARARLAGLGAGRGCSGAAPSVTIPKAFC